MHIHFFSHFISYFDNNIPIVLKGVDCIKYQRTFEILTMFKKNSSIHNVFELVSGTLLIQYIKVNPELEKKTLYRWIDFLEKQIEYYHLSKERSNQYINPYAILVTDDLELKLLDLEAKSNEEILLYMQKNIIQDAFVRARGIQVKHLESDFYSLAKTIQFILSQCKIIPRLGVFESHKLSRWIRKSLNSSYQKKSQKQWKMNIKNHNLYMSIESYIKRKSIIVCLFILFILIVVFVFVMGARSPDTESETNNEEGEIALTNEVQGTIERMDGLYFDLATLHLIELKEYEKAIITYSKINHPDQVTTSFLHISEQLILPVDEWDKTYVRGMLLELNHLVKEQPIRLLVPSLRIYMMMGDYSEAKEQSQWIRTHNEWTMLSPQLREEVLYYQLFIYDQLGDNEELRLAIQDYRMELN